MADRRTKPVDSLSVKDRPRAGEVRAFPTGSALYFSAPPLPTGASPLDLNRNFLEINEVYLDLGSSQHTAFSNQMMLSIPLVSGVLAIGLAFPVFIASMGYFFDAKEPFGELFWEAFPSFAKYGLISWAGLSVLFLFFFFKRLGEMSREYPMRFNRQRREVCYVDPDGGKPIFEPWEELVAWVSESTGATQYGVHRHVNFGVGVQDPDTGKVHSLLFNAFTMGDAMGMWEGLWDFMEYGPHRLRGIHALSEDDPMAEQSHDSSQTFDFQRKQMHEEYRNGERGVFGVMFWYVSHVLSFWKLPFKISAWEYQRARPPVIPEVEEWSQALPKEQWSKPSEAMKQAVNKMIDLATDKPGQPYIDLCEQALAGIPEYEKAS